jgi:hypothetical protein
MNVNDGHVYDLGADLIGDRKAGEKLNDEFMERLAALDREATADELAAARDMAEGGTIVAVDAAAAQRARLGDRELRRRRQRRRS